MTFKILYVFTHRWLASVQQLCSLGKTALFIDSDKDFQVSRFNDEFPLSFETDINFCKNSLAKSIIAGEIFCQGKRGISSLPLCRENCSNKETGIQAFQYPIRPQHRLQAGIRPRLVREHRNCL